MRNSYSNCFKVLLLLLFLIQLTGCAGKSFDYQPVDEIPKGPGVFSDQDPVDEIPKEPGVFSDQDEGFVKSDKRCAGEEKVLYYKEFQEYRGWKKWQRTKTGSDEFKEFQEWSEWKSYQEWKKKSESSTE